MYKLIPNVVQKELKDQVKVKAGAMVHSESSTGTLNLLREITGICQENYRIEFNLRGH